jgi:hypothetical protein
VRTAARIVLAAALLAGLNAAPAGATYGVGTDTGKIRLNDSLAAGGSYRLPTFRIINTGTQAVGYTMRVVGVAGKPAPESSWFVFKPDAFYLYPNQERSMAVTLHLPGGAAPGRYEAILAAVPALPGDTRTAHVDVGVGPRLTMTVTSTGFVRRQYFALTRWFGELQPWSTVAAGLIVAALAAAVWWMYLRRRKRQQHPRPDLAKPRSHLDPG